MAVRRSVFCFGLILVFFMLHLGGFGDKTTSSENAYLRNTLEAMKIKLGKMDSKLESGFEEMQRKLNQLTTCQSPFVLLDGRCYLFSQKKKSWSDAQAYCRSKYANLATITSRCENDIIVSYVRNHFPIKSNWWLGGNDMVQEGRWVWVDTNSAVRYTNWGPGQPDNNGGEHCLSMWEHITHRWNDAPCGNALRIICEK